MSLKLLKGTGMELSWQSGCLALLFALARHVKTKQEVYMTINGSIHRMRDLNFINVQMFFIMCIYCFNSWTNREGSSPNVGFWAQHGCSTLELTAAMMTCISSVPSTFSNGRKSSQGPYLSLKRYKTKCLVGERKTPYQWCSHW